MSNSVKKMPVTTEDKSTRHPLATDLWRPLEKLRQQVDHLFDDFNRGSGLSSVVDCSMSNPSGAAN